MKLSSFLAELKRRKVYRVAIGYTVVAWLLIQVATQVFPFLNVPDWAIRLVIIFLSLGFPIALVLAWAFDITPEGVKRTDDLVADEVAQHTEPVAAAKKTPEPIPEKSIAVLPFENLSDDQANEYFADGIQDDVLANLAKLAELKVISRTSVRQYRSGMRNLREIGQVLGVAHILEGTVRRVGNRVRVNVQLINARTDAHIWADSFDRELVDLLALQSELAERITGALRVNLSVQEKSGLRIHSTANLEAYENYLRARDLFRWSGTGDPRENGERALRHLERAITLDPQFALAHALASRWHGELFWFGFDRSQERRKRIKETADAALRLQPELSDAHVARAYYHYFVFRDYARAAAQLELARQATPNDAEIWDGLGAIERRQGHWLESLKHFEKARELDPRNTSVIWNLAETYAVLGRTEEAERAIAAGLEVNPEAHLFSLLRGTIALRRRGETGPLHEILRQIPREFDPGGGVTLVSFRLHMMEHDYEGAARALARSRTERFNDTGLGTVAGTLDGYSFPRSWLEGQLARARGEDEMARHAFRAALSEVEKDTGCCPDDGKAVVMLGMVHAALGDEDEAIRLGEEAAAMLPPERDAYDGPAVSTHLALIYTQAGKKEQALDLLFALRGMPMAATPAMLRLEPEWDALRGDARFAELS